MFDATQKGYEAGYEDGIEEKTKRPGRHMSIFKSIMLARIVRTFTMGYDRGHYAGLSSSKRKKKKK